MIETRIVVDGVTHDVQVDPETMQVTVDGHVLHADVRRDGTQAIVTVGDAVHVVDLADAHTALVDGRRVPFHLATLAGVAGVSAEQGGALGPVHPPMTGRVDAILVGEGQSVEAGEVLFVLEAMKMRNEVRAPASGVVTEVRAAVGDSVDGGDVVLVLGEA